MALSRHLSVVHGGVTKCIYIYIYVMYIYIYISLSEDADINIDRWLEHRWPRTWMQPPCGSWLRVPRFSPSRTVPLNFIELFDKVWTFRAAKQEARCRKCWRFRV